MDQYHTPALGPALAEGGPVGRVLLDDLIQGGLGIDGVGVELALAVRVVADLAVVALARLHKVLAQPWGNTHMTLIQSGGLRIFSSINFGRRRGGRGGQTILKLCGRHMCIAPCLVVWLVLGLGGQLLAHLLGQIHRVDLGLLAQLVSTVGVLKRTERAIRTVERTNFSV